MQLLQPILSVLYFAGISLDDQQSKWYKIIRIIWITAMLIFLIGMTRYLIDSKDISRLFQELMYILVYTITLVKVAFFMKNRENYLNLFKSLQANFDSKNTQKEADIYIKAEKECGRYIKPYFITIFLGVIHNTCKPILVVLYKYCRGTLESKDWLQPVPVVYSYDMNTTEGYTITYIILFVSFYGVTLFFTGLDALFLGMGIHIAAGFKDIQNMISQIDELIICKIEDTEYFENKIITCIKFHNFMLKCLDKFQEVNSGIIFANMVQTLLMLCSVLFKISKVNPDELILIVNILMSVNLMLLVYFYIGQLITDECMNVGDVACNSLWYLRTPRHMRFYLMIIKLSQKYRFLTGLSFFNCSMETYSKVLKACFSILAIMQNVD